MWWNLKFLKTVSLLLSTLSYNSLNSRLTDAFFSNFYWPECFWPIFVSLPVMYRLMQWAWILCKTCLYQYSLFLNNHFSATEISLFPEASYNLSVYLLWLKRNAQFIFLCNLRKSSINVYFMKILKSTVTKKCNCVFL